MNLSTFQNAIVEVDTATLEKSPHGSITGIITIRMDDRAFPDTRWNDFPVDILSWWLEPVARILEGKTRAWKCLFMDGPLSLRLEQQQGDTWTLLGLNHGRVEINATVSGRVFIQSLLAAAQLVLQECRRRGWQSQEIENLAAAIRTTPTPDNG